MVPPITQRVAPSPTDLATEEYLLGQSAAERGDTEKALEHYRAALTHDTDHAESRLALGMALVPLSRAPALGSSSRDQAVLGEAIEHLTRAQALRPGDAEYEYWLGRALDVAGREPEALPHLERAIALDATHGLARKRLGMVLIDLGEPERAREELRASFQYLPDDPGVRFLLGNLHFEDDPETARDLYQESIEISPYFRRGHHGLSQALAALGDTEGSQAAKEMAELCASYEQRRDTAVQAAVDAPDDFDKQLEAGEWERLLGDASAALFYYGRALGLNPTSVAVHHACGLVYSEAGELEGARGHFEEALLNAPDEVATRIELMRICALQEDATRFEELALELEVALVDADVATRTAYAEALLLGGRHAEARALLRSLAELAPDDEGVRALLERANS